MSIFGVTILVASSGRSLLAVSISLTSSVQVNTRLRVRFKSDLIDRSTLLPRLGCLGEVIVGGVGNTIRLVAAKRWLLVYTPTASAWHTMR